MGLTITEKILAVHAGKKGTAPGEILDCEYDLAMATDGTAPLAAREFREMGGTKVAHPEKLALINDHFQPAASVKAAELAKSMREFAREQGVQKFYEVGRAGICHSVVMEDRLVLPGQLAVGADSHSCTYGAANAFATGVGATDMAAAWALGRIWLKVPETMRIVFHGKTPKGATSKDMVLRALRDVGDDGALYRAIEYQGEGLAHLTMWERITITNMAIEMGGKNAVMPCDSVTEKWLREKHPSAKFEPVQADQDATYVETFEYDVSTLEPQIACPSLPSNVKDVSAVAGTRVDQVFIGSCTNAYFDDLVRAANILRGRKISPNIRCLVIPATTNIYNEAMRAGVLQTLADAGCLINPSGCGPCFGGHMGLLASGEVGFSTTNRNYPGRMGSPQSLVYLGSPETAAATAIRGAITDPREFLQ
jgi:3-isopropylmalate/(R)-2-methylmalate dehydratase large subunit